jgi:hypothetical protein
MSKSQTALLAAAKKIAVPDPGEIITIGSVELLCVWMKLNGRRVQRWQGSILVTIPDVQISTNEPTAIENKESSS